MPKLHMSDCTPYSRLNTSGAINTGVPALYQSRKVTLGKLAYQDSGALDRRVRPLFLFASQKDQLVCLEETGVVPPSERLFGADDLAAAKVNSLYPGPHPSSLLHC